MDEPKKFSRFERARTWYGRFERPISSLSLVLGFVFDALTLTQVDRLWENLWVVAHMVIVAVCIIWIHSLEHTGGEEADPSTKHFWLVNTLQFFFGGLLSTFLVFYFRSSDISVSWPFILILAIAFIANERLKRQFVLMTFNISILFLSIFSFAIFLVPVLMHQIGTEAFLISGAVSLGIIAIFLLILFGAHKKKFTENYRATIFAVLGIFVVVNVMYFAHFLPPIPLSLKDAGVYHSISRNTDGNYVVTYEDIGWRTYVTLYPDIHVASGDPVYVYSAVFSPSELNTTVVHEWQYYNSTTSTWVTQGTIDLPVIGGRDGGFRTYSEGSNLTAGEWRVNVKTLTGEVIGRIRFTVVPVATEPTLSTKVNG